MPSLDDVAHRHTALQPDDLAWLHRLLADWQIIADLSFADLLLWLPDRDGDGFWVGAQMRPTTGPTAYTDDLVGDHIPAGCRPLLDASWAQSRIVREGDPEWRDDVPVRVEAIPVRRGERLLGVVGRSTNLLGIRTPSRLELSYLQTAADLTRMIADGHFPYSGERSDLEDSLRVGDGFVRTDSTGAVLYASPNAESALRRLGLATGLVGLHLAATVRGLAPPSSEPVDVAVSAVLSGRAPSTTEIENTSASLAVRAMPLMSGRQWSGSLLLLRDVTELRRRERELVTKEATIREIHHRVKNNLQTVAALLRLQARRIEAPAARQALQEATRRVGSIAVVHEILSQSAEESVEVDAVVDRLRRMVVDVTATESAVTTERVGSFGTLGAEVATPLAMVLTELMQNAVEHGFAGGRGHVCVSASRSAEELEIRVHDDGVGLPPGFDPATSDRLGIAIVRALVESELGGTLLFSQCEQSGTTVRIRLPVS
ncbi:PAS domain-containing sensor histidine kinase [soil metagenome]